MPRTSVTVILCLPKELENKFFKEIENVFEKFGKKRLRSDRDGVYYNIPHITLLSFGDCPKKKNLIAKKLEIIAQEFKPLKIESKGLICFTKKNECHLVLEIKRTKQLFELHKKIYKELSDLVVGEPEYSLKQYRPHITIISSIPKQIGPMAKKVVEIKSIDFVAEKVAVKLKTKGKKAVIHRAFALKS